MSIIIYSIMSLDSLWLKENCGGQVKDLDATYFDRYKKWLKPIKCGVGISCRTQKYVICYSLEKLQTVQLSVITLV